jgi:ribosome biogenesis GTPase A
MAIHWYPGHMHKAQKEMKELLPQVDLLIEVLDARIPYSSENPAIAKLRGDLPCIKVLSKTDLADPIIT